MEVGCCDIYTQKKGKNRCGFLIFELDPKVKGQLSFLDFSIKQSQKAVILMVTTVKPQINQAHVFEFFPKLNTVSAETEHEISFLSTSCFIIPFPHDLKNFIMTLTQIILPLLCCTGQLFGSTGHTNQKNLRVSGWKIFLQFFECHVSKVQYFPT